ncbi:hypothetical protein BV25DRAFT_1172953 [Artomyces pyxidatus]|uniref:Uncharacterized protein n=1 Tax=Artomyces pyxidatus TaxID=48021 RepID=A0ACB8SSP9_9AGAM|nr:hypothetical protein BV25DRAFT_1172953 [Artomyces pyxidatus]
MLSCLSAVSVSSESTVGSLSFSDPRCEVHALFYDSRTFFAALIALFVAETTTLCVLVGLVGPTTVVNSHCLVTSISDLFTVYWCVFPRLVSSPNADNSVRRAVSLSFQSLLFALTLFKFFVAVRAGWGRTSVLARLATDGTWAYALIFSVMFANALLYSFEHTPLAGLCFSWLLTVLSISVRYHFICVDRDLTLRLGFWHTGISPSPRPSTDVQV